MNPDGSYRIQTEDYEGNVKAADVFTPDGLRLSYGSENYLGFLKDDYTLDVNYLVAYQDTPQQAVEDELDTTYYENNSDYSDITRTEVLQTTLQDGTVVY